MSGRITPRARLLRAIDGMLSPRHEGGTAAAQAASSSLAPFLGVLRRLRRLSGGGRRAHDPLALRARFEQDMRSLRVGFDIGQVSDLSMQTATGPLQARLYRPSQGDVQAPLLLYFHGGGFIMGDLDTHDDACRLLCEGGGMPVLSVAYRLAPEAPFPAAVDDALSAAMWARQHLAEFGAQALAIGGDSAGANLATVTAITLAQRGQPVLAQLLIYPGTDRSQAYPSHRAFGDGYFLDASDRELFYCSYLQEGARQEADWRVSPMLASVPPGLAPALLVTAGFDMLRDEGLAYARHLAGAGTDVQSMHYARLGHGFINLAGVHRASRTALLDIAAQWRALCRLQLSQGQVQAG